MTDPGGTSPGPGLAGAQVLAQAEAAILVTGADGGLRYANPFARRLFDLAGGAPPAPAGLAGQVLRGQAWDGTFAARRPDGTTVFVRAEAVPLRVDGGAVDGIVIIAREATRRGSQRERDRIRLLERIGERLAGSLELDVTLRHVAETLVPQFADHCLIDLFQGDKLIRRAQFHARDWRPPPGSWAEAGDQIRYPAGHFCQQAMARQEPVLVEDLADGEFPAPTEASLRAAEDVGLVSIVAVPLLARGQLLGVMSLALSGLTRRQDPRYDADDRDFLAAVAGRVAIAIDNASLFEEERRTALAFQTSLLPQQLPSFDGISVAWRYVPARPLETHGQGIQTQVGGDWYDLIPLSAGRVGIVIGDVEGRGARAAAVMGQLRAALRAFAQDDKPPAEILHKLDDWCRTLGAAGQPGPAGPGQAQPHPPVVSCTYFVYDAWSRTLSFANAGHDAPLLVSGGSVVKLPMTDKGLLLGVRGMAVAGAPAYREETRRLPPGSTLVLYTDGLTDRRQRLDGSGHYSEEQAFAMLTEAVRRAAGAGVQAIAQAAEEAVPGDVDDDMAIVVVQTSAERLDSWERTFGAEAIRVPEARRLAGSVFHRWGMRPGEIELTSLLVSEVVTNVVLHTAAARRRQSLALEPAAASGLVPRPSLTLDGSRGADGAGREFTLRLRRGGAAVWVEVFDSDLRLPRIRTAAETDEGGRGLYLVDRLASRWGSRPTRDGKVVWFEVPTGA
ncbi:MAG TPA: SpoIIE family protein phosphatase [Streptosporangiaceae bacterium]|nr:SpoIIE family protein phosphatase [Streptosporangiaceae bacterium]